MNKNRLKKTAKPRAKKKEVVLTVKLTFECYNDNSEESKLDCRRFKDWIKNDFTEWDDSILEYFLYSYGLVQDPDDDKYFLNMHIDNIIKDEGSTISEVEEFMDEVRENEENKDEM